MKIRGKLFVFILLTNSIIGGNSTGFKCLSGYKVTKDNKELATDFSETDCYSEDACFSAKGSFVFDGITWEVSEVRGCYYKDRCAESENDISTGVFERDKLKELLATEGVDINFMSAAEEGGSTPSELKCCYESLCDVTVVEPAEEGNSGYVVKNNLIILTACFAFAYKTFI